LLSAFRRLSLPLILRHYAISSFDISPRDYAISFHATLSFIFDTPLFCHYFAIASCHFAITIADYRHFHFRHYFAFILSFHFSLPLLTPLRAIIAMRAIFFDTPMLDYWLMLLPLFFCHDTPLRHCHYLIFHY
jgi:hypothetical protein